MNFRPKTRRQGWKPRTRFAKAKPRLKRGSIKLRKGNPCEYPKAKGLSIRANLLGKIVVTAAAGHKAGRRVKPKRDTPRTIHPERSGSTHRRERLTGKAREERRAKIFARSGGRCEEMYTNPYFVNGTHSVPTQSRCSNRATQWSHKRHAANKCDCYSATAQGACSIASCDGCHVKRHAGGNGKPCPSKPKLAK